MGRRLSVAPAVAGILLFVACTPHGPLVSSSTPAPTATAGPTASPTVYRCSRVELAAAPSTVVEAGTFIRFTATAYGCRPADFRFIWLQVATGDWQVASDWSPEPYWTWNTLTFSPAEYSIVADARARDEPGNGPDVSISMPVTLTEPATPPTTASSTRTARCAAVTVTVSQASPVTAGALIYFKATAGGCAVPQYRIHLVDLSTGAAVLKRDWGPSPDWSWDTTGVTPGRYAMRFDARAYAAGTPGYVSDTSGQVEVDIQ